MPSWPAELEVTMVRHLVLMRFREDCPRQAMDAAVKALRTLPGQIPEILAMTAGLDLGLIPGTCDLGVVVDFAEPGDYLTYAQHPAHRKVIEELLDPWVVERNRVQLQLGD
jgi:hypothetical protein